MAPKSSGVSKTARSSTPSVKGNGKFEMAADATRVIPLGAGEYAYVLSPAGRTAKLRVSTPEFLDSIRELAGTIAVRPTLAVLRRGAEEFANPNWALAVNLIQGIEPEVADGENAASSDDVATIDA